VALLVVLVAGAGIGVAVARPSPLLRDAPGGLAAAGVGGGAALAEQSTTTVNSIRGTPVTAPATTAQPTPAPTTTTRGVPTTRATTASTTTGAASPPPSSTSTTLARFWAPNVPLPVNPPAWTFEAGGVFARVRMTPIAPQVGDTVVFTIESWTDVPGRTCCNVVLQFGQDTVLRRWPPAPGPCPEPPPREDRVSYRIAEPKVLPVPMPFVTVRFLLNVASTFNPCAGPQEATQGGVFDLPVVLRPFGA